MSEQDRGAYTPQTDAPLAFDARQSRGGGGGGPAPLALLVSAIVLMALIVGLLLFYRHGVRHAGQAPEVVGAPVAQTKSAPSSDTADSNQAASLQVYKAEATPPSETRPPPSFETPPEQPAPLPAARPTRPTPSVISAEPLRGVTAAPPTPPAPKPVAKPVVVAKAAPPPPAAAAKSAPVVTPDVSNIAGSAFGSHPAAAPHVAPSVPQHVAAAPAKPAAPVAAAAAAKPLSAAKPKAAPKTPSISPETASASAASGGGVIVQIGAFSSAALAQKGWSDDAHAVPGAMAGKTRKVEAATKDGKTFYRAYVGGFATKAEAVSFCAALKAKDKPCFIAR
jgi:hypothetical protein